MSQQIISRLGGRKAIVTASTKGIGLAVARRLAQEGAKVLICSRKKDNVEKATNKLVNEGLDVKGIVCHVSDPKDRQRLLEEAAKMGGLDILVSCAAVNPTPGPLFECTEPVWDKIFDVNVKSHFLLTREALPLLRQSQAGRIIYITTAAMYKIFENLGAYSISKVALSALAKHFAFSLGKDNITVNTVAPGLIKTDFAKVMLPSEQEAPRMLSTIYLRRFGKPEDISGVVAFLASNDAGYITGENIVVQGGLNSRL